MVTSKTMGSKTFSKKEAFIFGWNTLKSNPVFFIVVILAWWILPSLPGFVDSLLGLKNPILTFSFWVASWLLGLNLSLGQIRISLNFVDSSPFSYKDIYSNYPLLLKYLVSSIIYTLVVAAGLILLVVPGLFFAIKYAFYGYFIVDKQIGPRAALKKSSELTDGVKLKLLFFFVLIALVNLLGVLAFLLGLFVTIPITMVATAYVYRKLLPGKIERTAS